MNASPDESHAIGGSIDLNADLGEGFPYDRALLERVTSASICCGAHAGNPDVIRQTLDDARTLRVVVVGAHPGYADRAAFGRREQRASAAEVRDLVTGQTAFLSALAREVGLRIAFLKPHGALYNQAQREEEIALALIESAIELCLPLLGQPGTLLARLARQRGAQLVPEGFIDRRYRADGSLMPRTEPNALLVDNEEIVAQAALLARSGRVATLCIHGDDPRAVANADLARQALAREGIAVRSFVDDLG
jgi:5-oxoprolinase (ATP-hydrolysing) subunit A